MCQRISLIDITIEDHLLNKALVELYTATKTAIINEPKTLQIFQKRDGYGCMLVKSKEEYDNKEFKKTIQISMLPGARVKWFWDRPKYQY